MSSDTTLFAHVLPIFTNEIEQVATEALSYILSESESARNRVADMVARGGAGTFTIANVETEVEVEGSVRVDLVGFDVAGEKRLLIEAKFWVDLTPNQPNTYLDSLPGDGPATLLFLVPSRRLETLWPEVLGLASANYSLTPGLESGNLRSVALEGSDRRLMMTDWSNILDVVHEAGDAKTKFETAQLRGLVDDMENDTATFLPLTPKEMEPDIPRRMRSLIRLVDDAVARAQASGSVSNPRSQEPLGGGYGKYVNLNGQRVWFGIYFMRWAMHGISPLWLWPSDQSARNRLRASCDSPDGNHFPVILPLGEEYHTALNEAVSQLERFACLLGSDSTV